MAEQMRPASKQDAPDPSNNYERAHPEREAGMGRLDNNEDAVPADQPEATEQAVTNRQNPERQINAHESAAGTVKGEDLKTPGAMVEQPGQRTAPGKLPPPERVDHSMLEEEPDGWDQAPLDIHDPRQKRHPNIGGKGGTPDAGEEQRRG